jgi:hypothetical protein
MKGGSCGEQVRQRASLNFDCVDQRSAVVRGAIILLRRIFSFFEFEKILRDYFIH